MDIHTAKRQANNDKKKVGPNTFIYIYNAFGFPLCASHYMLDLYWPEQNINYSQKKKY